MDPDRQLPGQRRPIDFVDGRWPDGDIRAPAGAESTEQDLYVAEQVVGLVRAMVARRERRGLRRSQLAALTGLRPNTISDIENGVAWPDVRTLAKIAWVLEADLELVAREPRRRSQPT